MEPAFIVDSPGTREFPSSTTTRPARRAAITEELLTRALPRLMISNVQDLETSIRTRSSPEYMSAEAVLVLHRDHLVQARLLGTDIGRYAFSRRLCDDLSILSRAGRMAKGAETDCRE
jgi:hypothetical protein